MIIANDVRQSQFDGIQCETIACNQSNEPIYEWVNCCWNYWLSTVTDAISCAQTEWQIAAGLVLVRWIVHQKSFGSKNVCIVAPIFSATLYLSNSNDNWNSGRNFRTVQYNRFFRMACDERHSGEESHRFTNASVQKWQFIHNIHTQVHIFVRHHRHHLFE